MSCDFTEHHYCEIVQALLVAGYRFTTLNGFVPEATHQVILRHDVDLSLEDALRIAKIEADLGVSSVFHFLLTAEVYNPVSASSQAILSEIRQLGHRIGLHVDVMALPQGDISSPAFFDRLRDLFGLARLVLGEVDSYSIHRPATNGRMDALQPSALPFAVPVYAYQETFRERVLYRSDSRRQWRDGCICQQIAGLEGRSVQLVIHPIWWTPTSCTRSIVLRNYLARQRECADFYLSDNLSFYKSSHIR